LWLQDTAGPFIVTTALVEPQLDGHTLGLAQEAFSEKACIDRASWPTPMQTAVI
jgi:hypothetical protein